MTIITNSAVMASVVADATVAAKKVENYSPEVLAKLLEAYKTEKDANVLANMFGKTSRSIVAKLSREKVWVKATYTTKSGEVPVSKEDHVLNIAILTNQEVEMLDSLEKANKTVLVSIENALQVQADILELN